MANDDQSRTGTWHVDMGVLAFVQVIFVDGLMGDSWAMPKASIYAFAPSPEQLRQESILCNCISTYTMYSQCNL